MLVRSWPILALLLSLALPLLAEDAPSLKLGEKAGDLWEANSLGIKFRWCPAGKFTMGSPESEKDRHKAENQVSVTLTKGFWLGQYEVTQAEWEKTMGTTPWKGQTKVKENANCPVAYVSGEEASEFCLKLTTQGHREGWLLKDWKVELPTEAQWEYACRAGTTTRFSFGDDESQLNQYAWFYENTSKIGEPYPHQVGQKKPNPWNLYDMHGNVQEWCRDWCSARLPGGVDPEVNQSAGDRVDRGGGLGSSAAACRSAARLGFNPISTSYSQGFRVALIQAR